MDTIPYEIERKYLICKPDPSWLDSAAERYEIVQTYLVSPKEGGRARVRKRTRNGASVYTHTVKRRVSMIRAEEWEREIDEAEYARLLSQADPARATIRKLRYCLPYQGQMFEIDLFPFWPEEALMEIELPSEDAPICFPPEIKLIREVTYEKGFSNASIAKRLALSQKETVEPERM